MAITSAGVESAALLMGVAALAVGLFEIPSRIAEHRRRHPPSGDRAPGPWRRWMGAKALGLGAVVAASGVAGGLVSLLDPGAAAERVVFGFLLGALPAIGLDLASGFIGATAPEEVGDALLAGLPGRAAARASAAGRTLAALSGGAAICAFVGVFESTDVAPVAIAAFLAGTLSTSVVVSLMRDDGPGRAMGVRRDQTPTGGAARSPGRTPLPAVTLGAYELLALGLGASTLIIAETPLSWFLFSNALLLPMLVAAVGVVGSLLASAIAGVLRGSPGTEGYRSGIGISIATGLLGATSASIVAGGAETGLWVPVALGAVMVELVSLWVLFTPDRRVLGSTSGTEAARRGRSPILRGSTGALGLAAVVLLGLLGAFWFAGTPGPGALGFEDSIGGVGLGFVAISFASWAPTAAWLSSSSWVFDEGRETVVSAAGGSPRAVDPVGTGADPRTVALGPAFSIAASASVGAAALLALVAVVPSREGIPPAVYDPKLTLADPVFLLGLLVGAVIAAAFVNRTVVSLGGRSGRILLVADGLLVLGLLFGPVGLAGFVLGGVGTAFLVGGGSLLLPETAGPERRGAAGSATVVASAEGAGPRGSWSRPEAELLPRLARSFAVGALLLATVLIAHVAIGGA